MEHRLGMKNRGVRPERIAPAWDRAPAVSGNVPFNPATAAPHECENR